MKKEYLIVYEEKIFIDNTDSCTCSIHNDVIKAKNMEKAILLFFDKYGYLEDRVQTILNIIKIK